MSNQKNDPGIILREHTYDGIEEFDQKLPNWWLFTLYIMIVAFVVYWVAYYQLPLGIQSKAEKVEAEMAVIEAKRKAQMEEMMATLSDDSLRKLSTDEAAVAAGEARFQTTCSLCHGLDLTGIKDGVKLPGVSLIDAEWLHGAEPLKIMNTVTNGSPDPKKGMIAWKATMSPTEIAQVVAYILSKQPAK